MELGLPFGKRRLSTKHGPVHPQHKLPLRSEMVQARLAFNYIVLTETCTSYARFLHFYLIYGRHVYGFGMTVGL